MINGKGLRGFLFFFIFFYFFLSDFFFKKKIKNKPFADRHVSVGPANSTRTKADSPLVEEKEELNFNNNMGPTP